MADAPERAGRSRKGAAPPLSVGGVRASPHRSLGHLPFPRMSAPVSTPLGNAKVPPVLPPRKPLQTAAPTFSPIAPSNRKTLGEPGTRLESPTNKRAPTPRQEVLQMKYRCPGCGLDFAKWSPCLAHLREFGHVEAKELDKSLHADFRRVQEMCALFYSNRLSHRLLAAKGDTSSSDDSDSEDHDRPKPPMAPGEKKPRRRSKRFNFFALPERVMFKINAFLDVDSATALFRAITLVSDRSVDESRVNRWSGSSQGSSSTTGFDGSALRWSHGHHSAAAGHDIVDANVRWSTGSPKLTGLKL